MTKDNFQKYAQNCDMSSLKVIVIVAPRAICKTTVTANLKLKLRITVSSQKKYRVRVSVPGLWSV